MNKATEQPNQEQALDASDLLKIGALFVVVGLVTVLTVLIIYEVDYPFFTWLRWLAKHDPTDSLSLLLLYGVPAGIIYLIWCGLRVLFSRKK